MPHVDEGKKTGNKDGLDRIVSKYFRLGGSGKRSYMVRMYHMCPNVIPVPIRRRVLAFVSIQGKEQTLRIVKSIENSHTNII